MSQPVWKFVDNLGDASPLEHGGFFVFVDETGVYPPEVETIESIGGETETEFNDDGEVETAGDEKWEIRRFTLDKCTYGMEVNGVFQLLDHLHPQGVLSDNKFHPNHPAWWAEPECKKAERPQDTTYLSNVCESNDCDQWELIQQFCNDDPVQRALAYREIMLYHGVENLDSYPIFFDCQEESDARQQLEKRYKDKGVV